MGGGGFLRESDTGTCYVHGSNQQAGDCFLAKIVPTGSVCGADPQEPNNSQPYAFPLTSGAAVNGEICPDTDEDWFSIQAEAGDTITADLRFTHADGDLSLYLYDSSGNLLDSSVTEADNECVRAVWGFHSLGSRMRHHRPELRFQAVRQD